MERDGGRRHGGQMTPKLKRILCASDHRWRLFAEVEQCAGGKQGCDVVVVMGRLRTLRLG